ncbi:MAG: hypothetical protein LBV61_02100 [Burkholderiaceae bacterium]|jgi:hypothetical protein|nr:hypothetical protein [Burkholderiaceae bacterium]
MRIMRAPLKLLLVSALLLCQAAGAQSSFTRTDTPWPDVPAPPKSRVQWVSDDMRVNGIPMKVQIFQSQASREEVVKYYVAYWGIDLQAKPDPAKPPSGVTPKGNEILVSRAHGPFYSLVKVRASGTGSEGTLSTSMLLGVEPRIDASGIAAPGNATAVNVVEAIDNGKRNKQALLLSRDSLSSVAGFYRTRMRADDWAQVQEQTSNPPGSSPSSGIVLMYVRDRQQFDVALGVDTERGLTVINANLINN